MEREREHACWLRPNVAPGGGRGSAAQVLQFCKLDEEDLIAKREGGREGGREGLSMSTNQLPGGAGKGRNLTPAYAPRTVIMRRGMRQP